MAYLDHAASTPMRPEAIDAMQPYLAEICGNPTGGHRAAQSAKAALEDARERVAHVLRVRPDEIVFTAGGSEGDNLALKGATWAAHRAGTATGIVVGEFEHKAVLGAADRLESEGTQVHRVRATIDGVIDLDAWSDSLDATVGVASLMLVNNETGVIQPLESAAELVRERAPDAVLFTDAVQAPQWLDVGAVGHVADLLALSGHKFGGPKGVGVLVVRSGVDLVPLVEGSHEWGWRGGTQNVAGIVGFAVALELTHTRRDEQRRAIAALRDRLEAGLLERIPEMALNGDSARRVEGALHVTFPGVETEALLLALDRRGVFAAAGSSCSSGATEPSHVLAAMGVDRDRALESVRLSLGYASIDADVDAALTVIPEAVEALRPTRSRL